MSIIIKIKPVKYSDLGWFRMWKGRKDMINSVKWVNDLRKKESLKNTLRSNRIAI